jgi:hypothetical protein
MSTKIVASPNPGPLARLAAVKEDPETPSVIFQRLTDGEELKEIARAWQVPKGRFIEWFTTNHADLYDAALKVRAADLAVQAMNAALEATPEDVAVRKLQADVSLKLAAKYDRARFGETVRVEKTISVTADAGLLGVASDLLKKVRRVPRVIDAEPNTVTLPPNSVSQVI